MLHVLHYNGKFTIHCKLLVVNFQSTNKVFWSIFLLQVEHHDRLKVFHYHQKRYIYWSTFRIGTYLCIKILLISYSFNLNPPGLNTAQFGKYPHLSNLQVINFEHILHGSHYSWNSWNMPGDLKFFPEPLENSLKNR